MPYNDISVWAQLPISDADPRIGPSLMKLYSEAYGTPVVFAVFTCAIMLSTSLLAITYSAVIAIVSTIIEGVSLDVTGQNKDKAGRDLRGAECRKHIKPGNDKSTPTTIWTSLDRATGVPFCVVGALKTIVWFTMMPVWKVFVRMICPICLVGTFFAALYFTAHFYTMIFCAFLPRFRVIVQSPKQ